MDNFLWMLSRLVQPEGHPCLDQEHTWEIILKILSGAGMPLGPSGCLRRGWNILLGWRKWGLPELACWHHHLASDERQKIPRTSSFLWRNTMTGKFDFLVEYTVWVAELDKKEHRLHSCWLVQHLFATVQLLPVICWNRSEGCPLRWLPSSSSPTSSLIML